MNDSVVVGGCGDRGARLNSQLFQMLIDQLQVMFIHPPTTCEPIDKANSHHDLGMMICELLFDSLHMRDEGG